MADFCTTIPPKGSTEAQQPISVAGFPSPVLANAAELVADTSESGVGAGPIKAEVAVLPLPLPSGSESAGSDSNTASAVSASAATAPPTIPVAAAPWDLAPDADAWLTEAGRVGEALLRGYAAGLSYAVHGGPTLGWYGIDPAWRGLTAVYNRSLLAVPLGGGTLHLVYRRDVLAAAATDSATAAAAAESAEGAGAGTAGVPDTWPELLLLARALHGRSMGASGLGGSAGTPSTDAGYGVCLDVRPGCISHSYLIPIWASLAVSQGSGQGLWFDPGTMQPLLDTPAFAEALRTWALLAALSPQADSTDGSGVGCAATAASAGAADSVHPAFLAGRCAITLASTAAVKALLRAASGNASGNTSNGGTAAAAGGSSVSKVPARLVGVAPLPGSASVLDRASGLLVQCSPELCPYGQRPAAPATAALSVDAAATAASTATSVAGGGGGAAAAAAVSVTVNRAPLAGLSQLLVGLVSARAPPWRQAQALGLLGRLAGPQAGWKMVLDPAVPVGPFRSDQAPPTAAEASDGDGGWARWAAAGYDAAGVAEVLVEAQAAAVHPNGVPPLAVPGAEQISRIVRLAADNMTAAVAAALAATWANSASPVRRQLSTTAAVGSAPDLTPALLDSLTSAAAATSAQAQAGVLELLWRGDGPGLRLAAAAAPDYSAYGLPSAPPGVPNGGGHALPSPAAAAAAWFNVTVMLLRHPYLTSIHSALNAQSPLFDMPPVSTRQQPHGPRNGDLFLQVGVALMCLFSAALTALLVLNTRKARGRAYYAADAPPVSPDTCLIVTDVQDSTVLWEQLPAHVMDKAMQVHHRTMRLQLLPHSGYEAATEGDSFIMAFLSATEALRYALAAQQALLEARWPPELLEAEACAPVWLAAAPAPGTSRADPLITPFTRRALPSGRTSTLRAGAQHAASAAAAADADGERGGASAGGGPMGPRAALSRQCSSPLVLPPSAAVGAGVAPVPESLGGASNTLLKHLVTRWRGSAMALSGGSGVAAMIGPRLAPRSPGIDVETPHSEPLPRLRLRQQGQRLSGSAAAAVAVAAGSYGGDGDDGGGAEEAGGPLVRARSLGGGSEEGGDGDGGRFGSGGGSSTSIPEPSAATDAQAAGPRARPRPGLGCGGHWGCGSRGASGAPFPSPAATAVGARQGPLPQRGSPARLILGAPLAAAGLITTKAASTEDDSRNSGGDGTQRARGAGSFLKQPKLSVLPRMSSLLGQPLAATAGGSAVGLSRKAPRQPSRLQRAVGAMLPAADGASDGGGAGGGCADKQSDGVMEAPFLAAGGGPSQLDDHHLVQQQAAPPPSPFLTLQSQNLDDDLDEAAWVGEGGGRGDWGEGGGEGDGADHRRPEGLHRPGPAPCNPRRCFSGRRLLSLHWDASSGGDGVDGSGGSRTGGCPSPPIEVPSPPPPRRRWRLPGSSSAESGGAAGRSAPPTCGALADNAAATRPSLAESRSSGSVAALRALQPRARFSLDVRRSTQSRGSTSNSFAGGGAGGGGSGGCGVPPQRARFPLSEARVLPAAVSLGSEGGASSGAGAAGGTVSGGVRLSARIRSRTEDGRRASAASAAIAALVTGTLASVRPLALQSSQPVISRVHLPLRPASASAVPPTSLPPPAPDETVAPLHRALLAQWQPAAPGAPGAVLVFRGLRVRVGLHAGVSSRGEMVYNRAAARMMYCGPVLRAAKAVADAAHGGQVVLSPSAFAGLSQWMLNGEDSVTVWFGGRHLLQDDLPLQDLYVAYSRALLCRAALLAPGLRSRGCLHPGLTEALVGPVALAALALHAPQGLAGLGMAPGVAERCCAVLECVAVQLMRLLGGSLYEAEQGCVIAAFPSTRSAALWLLHGQALLLAVPWEPALVASPVMERKLYTVRPQRSHPAPRGAAGGPGAGGQAGRGGGGGSWSAAVGGQPQLVTLASPRVKGVVDLASMGPEVQRSTGRLLIPLRQRQRIQKLLAAAHPGQVVCTSLVETAIKVESECAAATAAATAAAAVGPGVAGTAPPGGGRASAAALGGQVPQSAAEDGGAAVTTAEVSLPTAASSPHPPSLCPVSCPPAVSPLAPDGGATAPVVPAAKTAKPSALSNEITPEARLPEMPADCSAGASAQPAAPGKLTSHVSAAYTAFDAAAAEPAAASLSPSGQCDAKCSGGGGGGGRAGAAESTPLVEVLRSHTSPNLEIEPDGLWEEKGEASSSRGEESAGSGGSGPHGLGEDGPGTGTDSGGGSSAGSGKSRTRHQRAAAAAAAAAAAVRRRRVSGSGGGSDGLVQRLQAATHTSLSASVLRLPGMEAVRFARQGRHRLERLGLLVPPPPPPPPPAERFATLATGGTGASAGGGGLLTAASRRHLGSRPSSGQMGKPSGGGGGGGGGAEAEDSSHQSQQGRPGASDEAGLAQSSQRQPRSRGGGGGEGVNGGGVPPLQHRALWTLRLLGHTGGQGPESHAAPDSQDRGAIVSDGSGSSPNGGGGRSLLARGKLLWRRSETVEYSAQAATEADLELGGGGSGRARSATALAARGRSLVLPDNGAMFPLPPHSPPPPPLTQPTPLQAKAAAGGGFGGHSAGTAQAGARALTTILHSLPGLRRRSAMATHGSVTAHAAGARARRSSTAGLPSFGIGLEDGASGAVSSRSDSGSRVSERRSRSLGGAAAALPRANSASSHLHPHPHNRNQHHPGQRLLSASRLGHGKPRHALGPGHLGRSSLGPRGRGYGQGYGYADGGEEGGGGGELAASWRHRPPAYPTDPGMAALPPATDVAGPISVQLLSHKSHLTGGEQLRLRSAQQPAASRPLTDGGGGVGGGADATAANVSSTSAAAAMYGKGGRSATATDAHTAAAAFVAVVSGSGSGGGGSGGHMPPPGCRSADSSGRGGRAAAAAPARGIAHVSAMGHHNTFSPNMAGRGVRVARGLGSALPNTSRSGLLGSLSAGWHWLLHALGSSGHTATDGNDADDLQTAMGGAASGGGGGHGAAARVAAAVSPRRRGSRSGGGATTAVPVNAEHVASATTNDTTPRCLPDLGAARETEPTSGMTRGRAEHVTPAQRFLMVTAPLPEPCGPDPAIEGGPAGKARNMGQSEPVFGQWSEVSLATDVEAEAGSATGSQATVAGPVPGAAALPTRPGLGQAAVCGMVGHTAAASGGPLTRRPEVDAAHEAATIAQAQAVGVGANSGGISSAVASSGGAIGATVASGVPAPSLATREVTLEPLHAAALRLTDGAPTVMAAAQGPPPPSPPPRGPAAAGHLTTAPPPGEGASGGAVETGAVDAAAQSRPLVLVRVPPPLSDCPGAMEVLRELQASEVRLTPLESVDPRGAASLGCGLYLCMLEATALFGLAGSQSDLSGQEALEVATDVDPAGLGPGHGSLAKGLFGSVWGRVKRRAVSAAARTQPPQAAVAPQQLRLEAA